MVVEHGAALGVDVEVVTKDRRSKASRWIKRRWVVERTIGWLMQHRRLARDYETLPETSATMIRIAMIDKPYPTRHGRNHSNLARNLNRHNA